MKLLNIFAELFFEPIIFVLIILMILQSAIMNLLLIINPTSHLNIVPLVHQVDFLPKSILLLFTLKLFHKPRSTDIQTLQTLRFTNHRIKPSIAIMHIFVPESLLLRIFTYTKPDHIVPSCLFDCFSS